MPQGFFQGRTPVLPQQIYLPDMSAVQLQTWLRVLPNKRYVAKAQWQEQTVLIKVFVGKRAEKYFTQEKCGIEHLVQQKLSTPKLLASGVQGALAWLIFEFIEGVSLQEAWQQYADKEYYSVERQAILQRALVCIAQMHERGLWQSDLHLANLLQRDDRLLIIDGGGIAEDNAGKPLGTAHRVANLAVFFAQFDGRLDEFLPQLLAIYQQQSSVEEIALGDLNNHIARIRQWRLKDYLKKTARDCSLFAFKKNAQGVTAYVREEEALLQPILTVIDRVMMQGHIYKTGGTATVARVEYREKTLVIKRYNVKNVLHFLKRCWRPSRAWHSWQAAHRLMLLGIATPKALAVKENRIFGLRARAWLISEYCGEEDLIARFSPYIENANVPPEELAALKYLLQQMIKEKISHGDFKGHNIFWYNNAFLLIDLDAVKQHNNAQKFYRAFQRDRARLLRNWPKNSALYQLLDHELPNVAE